MRISRLTALLVAAAVATTTAGCGGDDDQDTSGRAATSTTAQGTTAPPPGTTTGASTTATTTPPDDSKKDPAPGRTVQAFFNAVSKRDGRTACTYMDEGMQRASVTFIAKNKKSSIKTCADAMVELVRKASATDLRKLVDVEITSSTSAGISATVKVKRATRDALLTRTGGRWLISGGIFDG